MEINTCEQYVLAELKNAHDKVDELIERNLELGFENGRLSVEATKLNAKCCELLSVLEVFYKELDITPYGDSDEYIYGFDTIFKNDDRWETFSEAYKKATNLLNEE